MDSSEFAVIFDELMAASREMLFAKAAEYATDDERLHNFIVAGGLQGVTPMQALGGMMAKHTVSIYDMIDRDDEGLQSLAKWDEKILDHINYLILLKACVIQGHKDREINTNNIVLSPENWNISQPINHPINHPSEGTT